MRPRKDRKTYFRCKRVVLTDRDDLAYSRVWREFGPDARIVGQIYRPDLKRPAPVDDLQNGDEGNVGFLGTAFLHAGAEKGSVMWSRPATCSGG